MRRCWAMPRHPRRANGDPPLGPGSAAEPLAGAHVLLTGATGFLGQALLEKLLSAYPTTRVTLLVRPRGSSGADDRLRKLLRKPVFSRWREQVGAEAVAREGAERVRGVEAALGAGTAQVALPADLDVVIPAASTVSFAPPIDQAFRTNVQGVIDLYQAVRDSAAAPHVVHVSTAYVAGARRGAVPEAALDHDADWRRELAAALASRDQVATDPRRPAVLREALDRKSVA